MGRHNASARRTARTRRGRSLGLKLSLSALALATFGGAFASTLSVFSSTISNPNNAFSVGTVAVSDNDVGVAMLALSAAQPGDSDTSCVRVSYTGTALATMRLYGTTGGSGLDAYLTLTVTRGTGAATFDSCTGFSADGTNYLGAGAGVIYTGTLQGFADDYGSGIVDPLAGAPESWATNETHDYKVTVTMTDTDSAQGKNASQSFTWEARTA